MGPGDTFECLKSGDTIVLGNAIFGRAAEEQDASELEKVALDLHAGGSNLQMVIDYLEDEAEHPLFDMWEGKVSLYALILSLTLHEIKGTKDQDFSFSFSDSHSTPLILSKNHGTVCARVPPTLSLSLAHSPCLAHCMCLGASI
jgi:hypothetical protein